jgi:hypothetical protein
MKWISELEGHQRFQMKHKSMRYRVNIAVYAEIGERCRVGIGASLSI